MNFYEHFFWNYAIFYRKSWAWKVGLGGVFPDLIYMVAFIPKLFSYQSFREWMSCCRTTERISLDRTHGFL
ncbi:MAG: hypothetical protein H8E17_17875 [Deltaproteobacteria bacterium]|nr:hypothetical protein [Deltaproteobacteria bacterium]